MQKLNFTTQVLGFEAARRLRRREVTQTIRSRNDEVVVGLSNGLIKPGDQVEVHLDGEKLGEAEIVFYCDIVRADELDGGDAQRGGFKTVAGLVLALRRAGYRFKALKDYEVYRIQFSWLGKEAYT